MALDIAGMYWGHLMDTMFDVATDLVAGAVLGSLATWTIMREPLPSLEDGSTVDGDGRQNVALADRMV